MRSASTGEILAAIRAGRRQEISTVSQENRAEPMKITGLAETEDCSAVPMSTGTNTMPRSQPKSRPAGMPARQRRFACP